MSELLRNQRNQREASAKNPRWWLVPKEQIADSVTSAIGRCEVHQQGRVQQYTLAARLYGNLGLLGPLGLATAPVLGAFASKDRVTFNVVQSIIDTIVAMLSRNRPRPYYLTTGGNWKEQRRARNLNRFVDGLFYECQAHDLGEEAIRDGLVFGDGPIHVFVELDAKKKPRIRMERVPPSEFHVDEVEAAATNGRPRSMHRVRNVDRAIVAEMFPDVAEAVRKAPDAVLDGNSSITTPDLVTIRESWHLPSAPWANDGRHVLTLDGVLLCEPEEWKHDFYPFASFKWNPRLHGLWGQGVAEQLQGIQLDVNAMMATVKRSLSLGATFKIWAPNGGRIALEHLNNDIGAIIRSDQPPQWIVPPLVQPEVYNAIRERIQMAYQQTGLSQLSATSTKPAGLNSGKALREMNDIESDRLQKVERRYERFYLDLAKIALALVRDVAGKGGSYDVRVPSKRAALAINWKDVAADEDSYILQCFPVSSLPNDPAGRLQTVQEYAQAGYLTPRQAKRLLEFPDLEAEESLSNSAEQFIEMALDKIVDEGVMTEPEPYDDLALWREMTLEYYARGKTQGLEEERLELLRRVLEQLDALEQVANPPAAPGGPPPAVPMAPPTSDLIPNVRGASPPQE